MLRKLLRDRRGNIAVMSAVMITSLVGVGGLVAEFGNGLLNRMQDQRIADAAAMAGGTVYNSTSSSTTMQSVVDNIAALNGLPTSDISAQLVSSPTGDGNNAVEVTVQTSVPLVLSKMLWSRSTLPVSVSSYAELGGGTSGCIIALNGSGTGITVASSSGITADSCALESNSTVTASSSSNIITPVIDYDTTPPTASGSSTIETPTGATPTEVHAAVEDPLAGTSGVTTATARLATVEAMTSPAAPSVTAGPNLSYSGATFTGTLPSACSQTHSGSAWTVTCLGSGPYNVGSLSVTSTATVSFNTNGSSLNVYNFSGGITVDSSAGLTFGSGTFNIVGGVTVASSSSIIFGAGTFDIGPSSSACTDGGKYSLCIESSTSLTMGGPSTFVFGGGIYAGSSATIKLGAGSTNSYDIGSSSNGNSAVASSSSNLLFADATGGSDLFELVGNVTTASSACVALPDAAQHDINGSISTNSSSNTTLGSGVYTVSGYLDNESSSGGGGCSGWSGGTSGTGVTFVLGATATPSSGSCEGMAICVLSSSHSSMVAPSSGPTEGLVVIGPTSSSNTAGGLFESSSSGSFSGAVYLPHGNVSISSSSGLGGGSGACLMLIAAQISVTSASATGSTCSGVNTDQVGTAVALVQ